MNINLFSASKYFTCLLLLVICTVKPSFSSEQLYTTQPTVTPELAAAGKYAVGVTTLNATNPAQLSVADFVSRQDRQLTLEVWYPAQVDAEAVPATYKNVTRSHKAFELLGTAVRDAKVVDGHKTFPLVVISHGYTGYRTIMFYLAEHLASHGYVVVGIDHPDSTNAEVDFTSSAGSGFLSTLRNRARDQQFVLEYFSTDESAISKLVDDRNAAVIGYSMGAYGAINTVGGCYQFSTGALSALGMPEKMHTALASILNHCNAGKKTVDPRWKAMLAFSPWGGELGVHSEPSLKNISVPSLYVAGNLDDVSGFEQGIKKIYDQTSLPSTYLMVYENARHNIAAHPAPKVAHDSDLDIGHYYEPSWKIEALNRINEHMSLAFLNCFVKKQKSFCTYIPSNGNNAQLKQSDGTLSEAWPGFKDRWGSGVSFYGKQ